MQQRGRPGSNETTDDEHTADQLQRHRWCRERNGTMLPLVQLESSDDGANCCIADTALTTGVGVCSLRRPVTARRPTLRGCPDLSSFGNSRVWLCVCPLQHRRRGSLSSTRTCRLRLTYSGWRCRTKPPTAVSLFCREVQLARESRNWHVLARTLFCAKGQDKPFDLTITREVLPLQSIWQDLQNEQRDL
jgi:hypothetical protein